MSFLAMEGKKILIFGVANKKSVAFHVGQVLAQIGAEVIYAVKSSAIQKSARNFLPHQPIYV